MRDRISALPPSPDRRPGARVPAPHPAAEAPVDPRLALVAAALPRRLDRSWSVELFRSYDGVASVVVARLSEADAPSFAVTVEAGALAVSGGVEALDPLAACTDVAAALAAVTAAVRAATAAPGRRDRPRRTPPAARSGPTSA